MSVNISHLSICKKNEEFNKHEQELNQLLHDMKSPISSLNLCLKHIEKQEEKIQSNQAFAIIKLALERLNSLVSKNQLIHNFGVSSALHSVLQEVEFCTDIKTSLINKVPNLSEIKLVGDAETFKTILFNMTSNSINASASKIIFEIIELETSIKINIIDNGSGIEKKLLNYIGKTGLSFQKSKFSNGQGLGLSHAKDTIKSWGGTLTIQSEINAGTEISVYLLKS